jgi:hypothetical protein
MTRLCPLALALSALAVSPAQAQVTYSNINDASFSLVSGTSLCQDYCSAKSAPDEANPNRLVIGFGEGNQGSCIVGGNSYPCWSDQAFHVGTQAFVARQRVDRICATATAAPGQYISRVAVNQRGGWQTGARGGHVSGLATVSIDNVSVFAGGAFNVNVEQIASQADVDARIFHAKLDICLFTSLSATNENFVYGRRTIIGSADARIFEAEFLVDTLPIPPLPVPEAVPTEPAPPLPVAEPTPTEPIAPSPVAEATPTEPIAPLPVAEPIPTQPIAPLPVVETIPTQ